MTIGYAKLLESGYDDQNDLYFIVMKKLDEDLNQTLLRSPKDGCLTLQSAINMGLQLLDRLEMLHEYGIVHRDLKPKNLMFDFDSQQLNLIDFGLSGSYLNQYGVHIPFRST